LLAFALRLAPQVVFVILGTARNPEL
jgi:hypothetical protein